MYILTKNDSVCAKFKSFRRIGRTIYGTTDMGKTYKVARLDSVDEARKLMVKLINEINTDTTMLMCK